MRKLWKATATLAAAVLLAAEEAVALPEEAKAAVLPI